MPQIPQNLNLDNIHQQQQQNQYHRNMTGNYSLPNMGQMQIGSTVLNNTAGTPVTAREQP